MKYLLIITTLLVLSFQLCTAQSLDAERIGKDWEKIKNEFLTELKKDTKNFSSELFNKTSQGGDEPFKPVIDYFKKLQFNGKDFSDFKKTKFGAMELNVEQKKSYNEIADKFIKQMQDKYKSTPKGKDEKIDKQSKTTNDNGKNDEKAKIDSVQVFKRQIDSLLNANKMYLDSIKALNQKLVNATPQKTEGDEKSFFSKILDNWIWILIVIFETALLVLFAKKWYRADTKNEDFRDKIRELKMQKQSSETQLHKLQNQKPKEKIIEKEVVKTVYVEKPKTGEKEDKTLFKYLCLLGEGSFGRIDDTYDEYDSYYRIKVSNATDLHNPSSTFEFEFHSVNHEMAIQNWSSVLTPAADWTGDYQTAKRIENIAHGLIQYDTNSECWNVIKKAKLKLF
ncbi:MAG: hypothetical protein IKP73_02975 [Bacteroidales bacterium]|nr:hypothetical protein [Bacteroidales bacterium]